jgi:hypothetical protein
VKLSSLDAVVQSLSRDVAIGGLSSPLLSWLAAAGLLIFFGWQAARLWRDVNGVRTTLGAVRPLLADLASDGEAFDLQTMYRRSVLHDKDFFDRGAMSGTTDMERLTRVDAAMSDIDALRRPWAQFRQTLLIERAPWFKEPHIYSTRPAEDFFAADRILGRSVDLAFYAQVPSLITGFGLLLTFVAICIGLSRLHADAAAVTGVQGLINGLAGKFLTSIVALVCANVFIVLERGAMRRLHDAHGEFLTLLDESFPRRTVEDLIDALVRQQVRRPPEPRKEEDPLLTEVRRLGPAIDQLAAATRMLIARFPQREEASPEEGWGRSARGHDFVEFAAEPRRG